MRLKVAIGPILVLALLSACGPPAARTAAAATVTAAAVTRSTAVVPKSATPVPAGVDAKPTPTGQTVQQASLPAGTIPPEAAAALAAARRDLQERLGLADSGAISVQSVEALDWPDASLGCPEPGKMYAQVIKPGFLIILALEGAEYEYHSDESGHVVLCEGGAPAARPSG